VSQKQLFHTSATNKLLFATIANACPHCGKPDWCYSILSFTVCDRDRFHQPNYALGQPKESPTYVLSNCQKLNNVQGGIA
jgi:hypothetical protein